jgi:hypothetical protein
VLGLCLDEQSGGGQPVRAEPADKLLGETDRHKPHGVGPVEGRVKRPGDSEVRGGVAENERPFVEATGESVSKASFAAEAGQHRGLVQACEVAEGPDPEPPEDPGELAQAENLDREMTEPLRS